MGDGTLTKRYIEIPTVWGILMEQVRSHLPSAFLAGGAIRDFDNQRPVKDLDVFFTEAAYHIGALEDSLAKLGYFHQSHCPGRYLDGTALEVYGSTVCRSTEGMPDLNLIQLVEGFNSAAMLDRFDFGLCQIGLDIMGVDCTPAYEYDREHQVLTLTRADSVEGVKRSLVRYERLSQKYQGWALNVPAEFAAIVAEARKPSLSGFVEVNRETF